MICNVALHLTASQLQHRCFFGCQFVGRILVRALLVEGAIHSYLGFHVSKLESRILELTYLLTKGLAFFDVLDGDIQGTFRGRNGLCSDAQALTGQFIHQDSEAFVDLTQQGIGR